MNIDSGDKANKRIYYQEVNQGQPCKSIKLSNSSIECLDLNNYYSLSTMIKVYNIYYRIIDDVYNDGDDKVKINTRYKCVVFFNNFHRDKLLHYIDVKSYSKFIVDVLFDPSTEVFEQMKLLKCKYHEPMIIDIYENIINHKRFDAWFNEVEKSDLNELRYRISTYRQICYFGVVHQTDDFYYQALHENINKKKNSTPIVVTNIDSHKLVVKDPTLLIIPNSSHSRFSDTVYDQIISFTLYYDYNSHEQRYQFKITGIRPYNIGQSTIEMSLVSKQFFKIISKLINNSYTQWGDNINLESGYSLIRSPPLFFDYQMIKHIRYDNGIDAANRLLSRVETFFFQSLEDDFIFESRVIKESIKYYLASLPSMPSLKNIIATDRYRHSDIQSKLLIDVINYTPNRKGHGIEHLTFIFTETTAKNIDFLPVLVRLHSKTLRSIQFHYAFFNDEDYQILLITLKELITEIKQHNIKFKIRQNPDIYLNSKNHNLDLTSYHDILQRIKKLCLDENDEQVYQITHLITSLSSLFNF
ncbi:hypothetical protein PPL_00252 [Heterostelium album PN500]|uniref:Uncharacterized protein n=1 Tax=Heterostelium pallidum (strain ATCC 26659 / Pp 5 / PN500) TaxID=670386 RepID=D3AVY6_HETP5|nr:hypothetical protein PPL_00252 [Heterostelium album PN500]EFA86459.1 hypothetical protein PPL_00252 [Heterostelium album PN500]|eukprot:XP_020438564.1 hypothetical protein PPL_00252 [Heterostelium album PN500]